MYIDVLSSTVRGGIPQSRVPTPLHCCPMHGNCLYRYIYFNLQIFENSVAFSHAPFYLEKILYFAIPGLGCFSNVDVQIDTAKDDGKSSYEVTFKVNELKRFSGAVNTMMGNQEGSVSVGK